MSSSPTNSPVTPPLGRRDDAWIQDAVAASIRLSNMQPTEKLQSHAQVFAGLASQFQSLASQCMTPPLDPQPPFFDLVDSAQPLHRSSSLGSSISTGSLSPVPELSTSARQTPAPESSTTLDEAARELLKHAMKRIPSIMAHSSSLDHPQWAPHSTRGSHLRAVSAQNCHGKTPTQKWLDRLFHICASQSYARDLRAYEARHGLKSKHETLVKRVNTSGDIQAHRISDHLSGYLGTRVDEVDKHAVRAGLRFGVKLNVIEHVGESLGYGHAFGLLFGYDNKRVFRLPYQSIISLQNAIRADESVMAQLAAFCNKVDGWWRRIQASYHEHFADANNAADPMRMHAAPPMNRTWSAPVERSHADSHPVLEEGFGTTLPSQWKQPVAWDMTPPQVWNSPSLGYQSYSTTPCVTPFEYGTGSGLGLMGQDGYFDTTVGNDFDFDAY